VLGSDAYDIALPLVGEIHLVTSLFFDVGVFLVVVGLVLDILRTLGAEIDRHAERAAAGREPGEDTGPFEAMEPDSIGGGRR
jgi:multicomponent Na+:H+ antiporter subunit A